MPLKVRRLPQADDDIYDIWLTIAADSPRSADRVVERIYAAEDLLADFPELGEARPEFGRDVRKWRVGTYLIIYRVGEDCVDIIRVVHGARDLDALFGSDHEGF